MAPLPVKLRPTAAAALIFVVVTAVLLRTAQLRTAQLRTAQGTVATVGTALTQYQAINALPCDATAKLSANPLRLSTQRNSTEEEALDRFRLTFPDGAVRFAPRQGWIDSFWRDSFVTWEESTLELFYGYLRHCEFDYYIGFGEWIGPTVMFAAPYVKRAFALEPDPSAFTFLSANIAANPDLAARTVVSNLCIAPRAGTLTLRGSGASGSFITSLTESAGIRQYIKDHPTMVATVDCLSLGDFATLHEINLRRAFVKVDTEGAEWMILPSLYALVAALAPGQRPTFIVSLHADEHIDEYRAAVYNFSTLFMFAGYWHSYENDGFLPITSSSASLTLASIVAGRELILSDYSV